MCKKLSNILLLSLIGFASCTQATDEPTRLPDPDVPEGMHMVEMSISRASATDFEAAGIDKYTIYIYKIERKSSTLYSEKEVNITDDKVSLTLPLGEQFQAFAVANAGSVTDKESFETVTLNIDPFAEKAVWLSTPVKFASDKSVASVSLPLQRAVSRVDFTPAETLEELTVQTHFDKLTLSFTNASISYKVNGGVSAPYTVTAETDASKGYKTSFYTFETSSIGEESMLDIMYSKDGQQVNTSAGSLETGVRFTANNLYTMAVPVLSNDFVMSPWSTMSLSGRKPVITVTTTSL